MSIKMMLNAMQTKVGSPATKLVLLKLADNASDSGECWPSYENIAKHCDMSRRSAINHIDKLIELGLVTKTCRKGVNGNTSNIYCIVDNSEKSAPPSEKSAPTSEEVALTPSEESAPESVSIESVNESVSCEEPNGSTPKSKIQTPYKQIIELYAEILPHHQQVRKYDTRKPNIKARHKDLKHSLDNWRKYFEYVRDNCQWMTSGKYPSAEKFDYLFNASNFEDIYNGGKDDRE